MPGLRRLSGKQVISILEGVGFEVVRVRGSHHQLQNDKSRIVTVPMHGNHPLPIGTLKSIYRQACVLVSETELRPHFYTD